MYLDPGDGHYTVAPAGGQLWTDGADGRLFRVVESGKDVRLQPKQAEPRQGVQPEPGEVQQEPQPQPEAAEAPVQGPLLV